MIRPRRVVSPSSALAALAFSALVLLAANASADDPTKDQCIAANEGAQSLRQTGKLQAARAQLLICIATSCPGPVRDDCAERLNDLDRAIPSVVFSAKGNTDADLSAVKVTMDGAPLADRLDGTAISVEPGEHTFEFTAEGYPLVSKRLVIREGVKGRLELIAFATAPMSPVIDNKKDPVVPVEPKPLGDAPSTAPASSGLKTWGLIVGGAGLAGVGLGVYFGLRASSKWSSAQDGCKPGQCASGSQAQEDQADASSAGTLSTIAFVIGGTALVTGITLFVLAPSTATATATARAPVHLRVVSGLGSLAAVGEF
jgi:hypothetical protein